MKFMGSAAGKLYQTTEKSKDTVELKVDLVETKLAHCKQKHVVPAVRECVRLNGLESSASINHVSRMEEITRRYPK